MCVYSVSTCLILNITLLASAAHVNSVRIGTSIRSGLERIDALQFTAHAVNRQSDYLVFRCFVIVRRYLIVFVCVVNDFAHEYPRIDGTVFTFYGEFNFLTVHSFDCLPFDIDGWFF